MQGSHVVHVSARHAVTVDDDYWALVKRAPQQDYVVRTLASRTAGDTPLMSGELVIAGRATREQFPLAAQYPLHFRKTYYPGMLRGDPEVEFERHGRASEILGIPPPIGWSRGVFRSCLLPGKPYDAITPFGTEPEDSNIKHAEKLSLASAAGLWLLAEQIWNTLQQLQQAGLAHGDAELHNFIVCSAPLEVLPIDFDMALLRDATPPGQWQLRCAEELVPLLKVAVYLQCTLGVQPGPLAQTALARIGQLFTRPAPFERAIEERSGLRASL